MLETIKMVKKKENSPFSQVNANCIEFPPAPQNASIIVSHLHFSAICCAIFSGVTENQLSVKSAYILKNSMHKKIFFLNKKQTSV